MRRLDKRFWNACTGALGLGLLMSAGAAHANTANGYNVFIFNDFSETNSEVNGAVAVGNNASFTSSGVGVSLPSDYSGASLVVGGNLNYSNGQVFHGDVLVGGTVSGSGLGVTPPGTVNANVSTLPVDFAAEATRFTDLSSSLASLSANGTVSGASSLVFTGTDATLNLFNITAEQLGGANEFSFVIPTGSTAVFNVSGSSFTANWPGSFLLNGETIVNQSADLASSLLFNFSDATALTFNGSWAGNVLAPNANVTLNYGGFFGSLVANNATSTTEFYDVRFPQINVGPIPGVPEPATWAMMIAGFGLIGAMARRKQRSSMPTMAA
ncbi:MAG: choice-of-anchor A family protein [Sphingomonadales bacterium]|nr:MAG: choice-of-anchor A family protein [Sphingomonadales bacterium]